MEASHMAQESISAQQPRKRLMGFAGPQSRLRLATGTRFYASVLVGLLRGNAKKATRVAAFQTSFAADQKRAHCLATPMARTGLYVAIKALISPGQKVVLSPYTIAEVVNMVLCAGGVPVFCDIRRQSCNMDPDALTDILSNEGNIGAVLVTHFYGLMSDLPQIAELCDRAGIPLVEDAAQALGSVINGRTAGNWGVAGVFSFGMFKSVNALYGGAVVTDDADLMARMNAIWEAERGDFAPGWLRSKVINAAITDMVTRDALFSPVFFRFFRWAVLKQVDAVTAKLKIDTDPQARRAMPADYLYRVCDLQADLVEQGLENLPAALAARRANAEKYASGLSDLNALILPPTQAGDAHSYWYFAVQFDQSEDLVAHVLRHGQDITISYHRNCADLPCFAQYHRSCPNAAATAQSLIYLPCYPDYRPDQIDRTIAAIRGYFGK